MISREGEEIPFKEAVDVKSDPKVHVWLHKVEEQMRFTLASLLDEAIKGLLSQSSQTFNPKDHQVCFFAYSVKICFLSNEDMQRVY
jgi:hypothetical protein